MTLADYTLLDRPDISANSFYPRPRWTPTPTGSQDHMIEVDEGISLSCRFFPVGPDHPTILFFYGNGETAADYDGIAPAYNRIGANFFVADYRGYGNSGGSPSFTSMLSDAHKVLAEVVELLNSGKYNSDVFVMGRSMGRHAAFELAAQTPDAIKGLIVESGRPSLGQFVHGISEGDAQKLEQAYRDKVSSISVPVLVIHGERDTLAPLEQAVEMYHSFASAEKQMITIPGAGHNDLLYLGLDQYFGAIQQFVSSQSEK